MIQPDKLFGRLGNRLFKEAFLYSYALDIGCDPYFQDPQYFERYEKDIRALFSADIPERTDAVAIHVRRGDYVGNPFYVDLSVTDYYRRAMSLFKGSTFMVFSDDINWCKQQEIFADCMFFHEDEITDMNKMASCKGHIIANSSFSWWGAWLCPVYPKNKVVAPKAWYRDGIERTFCPDHWIRI